MSDILNISDLTVIYGKGSSQKTAVENVTFSVRKGELFGFLGPNGAGKTTTIKTILGLINPTGGSASLFGQKPSSRSRQHIGYMPETALYYWYLTPVEILDFYGRLCGIDRPTIRKRTADLLKIVDLEKSSSRLMRTFSKGMLQKVSFAQALINDPDLLILDEPTTGLDPIAKMDMRNALIRFKERGKTIFFSSHELSEVELISDRVAILKDGHLLKEGSPKELLNEKGERVSLEKYFFDLVKR